MKKIIPVLLIIAFLLSLSGNVLATETTENQDITATYTETASEAPVITVVIKWEGTDFTYVGAESQKWNPETHKYEDQEGAWQAGEAVLSITNHSDVMLQADLQYTRETGFEDIDMHFTNAAPYVGSAYTSESGGDTECQVQVLAVPTGELPSGTDGAKIGSIKLTLKTVTSHSDIYTAISGSYTGVPVYTDAAKAGRGTAYFASDADKSDILTICDEAGIVLYDDSYGVTQKNDVLNRLIDAYYNKLKIGQ